ncbi:MAG TPA: zf-HC2 domain-containing protein [Streptosporangiaceae bacterium]|nr:zf-HC2 domain-containing protein [Streptosporangiaceae bacterium]
MSDPACRNYRELLGVYVVGAIEPHERSLVDAHLNQCYGCREELAGLAVLPAMLHRIPVAEAEQIAHVGLSAADQDDPAPEVLAGLLTEVRARRRTKRLRTVLAAAAAVIVAVSGSVVATSALSQHQQQTVALEVVKAHRDGMFGEVKYGKSAHWGTVILTRVRGVPEGTHCEFWITTANGHTELVGGWLVGPGGDDLWYPSTADVLASSIRMFTITSDHKVLLRFAVT